MSKLLVFGHQNPDTDAITSAISYAYLLRHLGEDAEAVALGTPNEETQYALEYFKKRSSTRDWRCFRRNKSCSISRPQ